LSLLATLGCDAGGSESAQEPYGQLEACSRGEGLCGELALPLFHDRPEDEKLTVAVRVHPARSRNPDTEAVYVLVGGPGQAATEVGPMLGPVLDGVAKTRDVVFVDQRGTGRAGKSASLFCEVGGEGVAGFFDAEFPEEKLRACLETYPYPPAAFTTEASVADLEFVRRSLGHERIHLFGLSYGTRLALSYLRRHPEPVVTAILDGVAPPSVSLASAMDRGAHEMLERTFRDCAESAACAKAYPRLAERFDAWMARHAVEEAAFDLEHPRTGERSSGVIDAQAVLSTLRTAIYSPETAALIPLTLDTLMAGDPSALMGLAGSGEGMGRSMSLGLFLSVVCAEDMTHVDEGELAWSRGQTRFGARTHADLSRACAFWPSGKAPDDHAQPVSAATPILMLSGELDPATPARWAEEAGRHLAHSHHVVVPGAGHGTWSTSCVPGLIQGFMDDEGAGPIELGCVEGRQRSPFFVSLAGPSVRGDEEAKP
jgi:pimeloyl-ACP methyl ester carboxylesterase